MKVALIVLFSLLIILVFIFLFTTSSPKIDPEYFDYAHLNKYSSPVDVYKGFINFLRTKDRSLFQEMIGRKLKESEELPDIAYKGLPPSIQEYKVEKDQATIITSDGVKIEMEFLKGRWVLSQKNSGFYLRKFIRSLKSIFGDISKKLEGEKTEKITAPAKK
ncbi:MAG: hypothetical protein ACUVUG_09530 [Candidatus Aminicenantia bacterium]